MSSDTDSKSSETDSKRRPLKPATAARAWRGFALALWRIVRGAVSDAKLRLSDHAGRRGAVQGRRTRLHLFALLQSDRRDVRAAHVPARGRRGGARRRAAWRPSPRAYCRRSRPAIMSSRRGAVRLLSLRRRELLPRFGVETTLVDGAISRVEKGAAQGDQGSLFGDADQTRGWRSMTSRHWPISLMRPGRGSSSTMSSRRPCCKSRLSSAPISSSIPRPSILTGRGAVSAA